MKTIPIQLSCFKTPRKSPLILMDPEIFDLITRDREAIRTSGSVGITSCTRWTQESLGEGEQQIERSLRRRVSLIL